MTYDKTVLVAMKNNSFFFKVAICKTISKDLFLQEKYNMQDHAELSFTELNLRGATTNFQVAQGRD